MQLTIHNRDLWKLSNARGCASRRSVYQANESLHALTKLTSRKTRRAAMAHDINVVPITCSCQVTPRMLPSHAKGWRRETVTDWRKMKRIWRFSTDVTRETLGGQIEYSLNPCRTGSLGNSSRNVSRQQYPRVARTALKWRTDVCEWRGDIFRTIRYVICSVLWGVFVDPKS